MDAAKPEEWQDECLYWLALRELGTRGTARWWRAARHLGGAKPLFRASTRELRDAGLGRAESSALRGFSEWSALRRQIEACRRAGIAIVTIACESYPALLRVVLDPPLTLYYLGSMSALQSPCVSIVGSRRPTRYGRVIAAEIARTASGAGLTVVSGLALGVDAEVHRAALSEGASVAVMAGGLDSVYPPRNSELFRTMAERYCVVSEYPPGVPPLARNFPVRNRIITGVSRVTVIVQGSLRSGTMVSARLALEQGREVYAVPGNIDSYASEGPNRLIRDGAAPITAALDVLAEYNDVVEARHAENAADAGRGAPRLAGLDADAATVAGLLEADGVHVDRIIEESGLDGARIMELLTALELQGVAQRLSDGTYALSKH